MNRPRHCSNRLFDWTMAFMMLGIALCVAITPKAVSSGSFYLMQDIGLTSDVLSIAFLVGGCLRMAALWANGNWKTYGAMCRVTGSVFGATVWGQMAVALLQWSRPQGYIAIGVVVYAGLAISEIISCARAVRDGRR